MVFNKKKGMMVKSNVKNKVSTMSMKKNIFETKLEENDDDDDFEDSDDSFEMSVDEDERDRSDMKDQLMSNSKNAKGKLTPGGKKDMHVSFQLPNKGGSTTKSPRSMQNTPQSGKKKQNVTSPKQNSPMPGKKNQLLAISNKNSPMFSKKQALAAQNQSLISSGKRNQGSPVPTNLKQFGGVKPNQKPKGKSNTNVSMDNDDEDDNEVEDDDEDDNEVEDDDEDDNKDDTEDMPTLGQKIQPQNNTSKKYALANNKQQQQVAKKPQNNVIQGMKNQAVSGNQNSNVALQGKKAVKRPGAYTNVNVDIDNDDEDDEDDTEDMPTPGQKIQPQNNPSKKSALTNNKQQQQVAKPLQNNVVQGKKNQAVSGNQNSNAALPGKKTVKGPGALLVQQDDDKDDEDDDDDDEVDEEEGKKVIQKKNVSLKQDMQSKQPESKKKNKNGLTSVTQETPKDSAGFLSGELLKKQVERIDERNSRRLIAKGFPAHTTTAEEVKALSSDILNICFRNHNRVCFLDFESEEKAVKNHKHLQGKKFKDRDIFVRFAGSKIKKQQIEGQGPIEVLKDRLLCDGIPAGANISDIIQLFPTAFNVTLRRSADDGRACATFRSFEDAAEAFKANENAKIQGKSIVVLYAPLKKQRMKQRGLTSPYGGPTGPYGGPRRTYGGPAAKKRRF